MYWSKKFCEMLVPLTVATAGELSAGVVRPLSVLGWAGRQADQPGQQEEFASNSCFFLSELDTIIELFHQVARAMMLRACTPCPMSGATAA